MEKKLYHTPEMEQLAYKTITTLCYSNMPGTEHQGNEQSMGAPQRSVF